MQSKWICVQKINNNNYRMLSKGLTTGVWPGFAAHGYAGFSSNYDHTDISQIPIRSNFDANSELKSFYDTWKEYECTELSKKEGLYLLNGLEYGRNPYLQPLVKIAPTTGVWTGHGCSTNSGYQAYVVVPVPNFSDGTRMQTSVLLIAPCFNLNVSEIKINTLLSNTIMK